MEIKSDNSTYSDKHPHYKMLETIQTIASFTISTIILLMSFGYYEPNLMVVAIGLTVVAVLYNLVQSQMTLELAQRIADDAMGYILKEKPILGPIGLLVSLTMLGLLVTGNLFGWQFYIAYIIVVTIISKAHKSRLGIKEPGKK